MRVRFRPIAACLALAAGGAIAADSGPRFPVPRGAIAVTNCDDAGTGSLRDSIAAASSGDTIDLTQLACSTITLTSGAISVVQDDLSLLGPGAASLAIDGAGQSGLLRHSGAGTLSLDSLTLTHGYLAQYHARGGCVFSSGSLALYRSVVSDCTVMGANIRGGGVFATHDLTIDSSIITRNLSDGGTYEANAGGFFVGGSLRMSDSTISDNEARTAGSAPSGGGGAATFGDVLIVGSTISGNRAKDVAGLGLDGNGSAVIVNSTVSGNVAGVSAYYGGIYAGVPLSVYNSTIAFNAGTGLAGGYGLHLESTLIADNTIDFHVFGGAVTGTHNLIVTGNVVPPDTLRTCAHVQPLADNGGPTRTNALIHASPAIDTGDNAMALADDQRGVGFLRSVGAAVDIGAFEWQGADDAVFSSGFESGCER